MIILDLYSEVSPQYPRLKSFYGQPFIWNMLHDFGGTVAMYGAIDSINKVTTFMKKSVSKILAGYVEHHHSCH